tara:strand:+ start:57 stop:356 length:300 start_codon:yes stop_codon:yes gene_type:complete
MFELTLQNISIAAAFFAIIVAWFLYKSKPDNKEVLVGIENPTNEQLKKAVHTLADKLKKSEESLRESERKIKDLHYAQGIQLEQTKFLTANVNKNTTVS